MAQISVIVPVYKVEEFIHRCLNSILNQTFDDFELILVDDGSPDRCGAICDEYAGKDSRIRVIHQKNGGVSVARNTGVDWVLSHSDTPWIAFIDSDDWVHKDYLRILYDEVQRSGTKAAVCGRKWVREWEPDPEIGTVDFQYLDMDMAYSVNYAGCNPPHCKILDRDLLREIRFPVGKTYEDVYILYRVLMKAGRISVCNEMLYYYYQNPESITHRTWSEHRLDQIDAHEKRLAFLKENGYKNAYSRCVEVYTCILADQAERLQDLSAEKPEYKKLYADVKKKLYIAFWKTRCLGGIPLTEENYWVYEQMWLMRPFVKIHSILHR